MSAGSSRTGRSLLLLAPLLLFLVGFFVWPLISMMSQAVSDPAVLRLLPRSAEVLADWDRASPPTMPMQAALMEDLKAVDDDQALGDMVRRLNSARSGFRTLMAKTTSALDDTANPPADLVSIDQRWERPEFWLAIADALSPYTDRNLLAAVDLGRNAAGSIEHLPADQSVNRVILVRTFWIAALVTFACACIGFPYAIIAASLTGWKRDLMLGAVLLPLWTSLLVRTAAWFILLQEQGLINDLLRWLRIIDAPLPLIFNRTGVIIAMTHVLLPFMVLPIYSVLITIPKNLMPAAASLGAPPWRAFLRVLLPLSLRGVASGSLLVFISAIGYYITPALIGGPGDQMISSIIAFYATGSANWGMAGALGVVLLVATLLLYSVYARLSADEPGRR
ncbi:MULTISPECIES: ABC transporter permease [unclassified Shinella]|uniref:ABC transporter permease n=1 Tax=Shinella TaxID=323620 RepID=UPI00225CD9B0|nr:MULTISPECIES: ABC transporter permease [unclassified Shinella]CAI0335176.1 Spermidine Putrescine ABC transporter permease component potB (TC_3.A.1.11.1) [Rhizobiaceae bacterium]CAK7259486.1 putative spermidine/putrescine transport system permease protein [Shinella sp. WSC3-e]MCO5137953.1 ABC transporter permease [Shinella sp.]MCW5707992.1 ABC transporter permease [Shinella sp.]MDC7258070.1 ABC transporter permease [Shinella sp. YE25]